MNAGAARRRQQAETWLWLALTGNSPRELTAGETDEPIGQQALDASVTAHLAPALVVLGARHLLQRGLEGTARADLSGWDPTPPEPPSDLTAPAPPRRHHKPERTPMVRTGLAPLGNDPDIDRLIGLFGIDEVAAMLGLERQAVDRIRCGTRTPKGPRRRRVAYLLDLVDTLAYHRDDFHVRAWLTDKTPGEAPRDLLAAGSWEPSDTTIRDLLRRAQQETPGSEALRLRLVIVTEQTERTFRRPHPRVVPTDVFVVVTGVGAELTGQLLNALPVVVQRYRCGNAYPSRQVLARFNHIATIIAALAPRATDAIVAWFATPSPDLSGHPPTDILAKPWAPNDLLAALVLEVARSNDISSSQLRETT